MLATLIVVSGCATTNAPFWKNTSYGTWNFPNSEVKILPIISIRKILSSASVTKNQRLQILIKAQNIDGIAEVKQLVSPDDVIAIDEHGKETKVKLAQIMEIQTTRWVWIERGGETIGKAAEASAEALLYAPLVPLAIAGWPFWRSAGFATDDSGKAMLAYEGMTKEDLVTYIGNPVEIYHCNDEYGGHEIWVYKEDKVLRGGRALFISSNKGKVFHASNDPNIFKKSTGCSALR